ncbi:twin-arginine translocase subunit TatB [Tabrizicola sp. TH137]|uniref:Sec-independent protein translocase protein TatB n=1 Tax=Tabrizicola sp. TH137 TaxID=2067452 RepID=UPI000C79B5B5|nr:Sec-independent protein translocase protein TatB [Tabrizicola sp. TH137]PLL13640.1 twin-arginine translocase subunit TatB [Tabrizicola sp. TH137]
MDFGWAELLVIGVVALIVIGPKDLPEMFRTLGRFTAKARSMARDFSRAMEQAARDSGVDDVAKDLKDIKTATSPKAMGLEAVKSAADKFEKWDPLKNAAKPTSPAPTRIPTPPPMPPTPAMVAAASAPSAAAAAPAAATEAVPPAVAAPAAPRGPATQALAEKQAKKAAIARDAAEKLRAVDAEPQAAPASATKPETAAAKPKAPAKRAAKAQDKTE